MSFDYYCQTLAMENNNVLGVAIYANGQLAGSRMVYTHPSTSQPVGVEMLLEPAQLATGGANGMFDNGAGLEYVTSNGVILAGNKMKFVKFDDEDMILTFAGKSEEPQIPAGCYIKKTPKDTIIIVAYGPAPHTKQLAVLAADKIFEKVMNDGY